MLLNGVIWNEVVNVGWRKLVVFERYDGCEVKISIVIDVGCVYVYLVYVLIIVYFVIRLNR